MEWWQWFLIVLVTLLIIFLIAGTLNDRDYERRVHGKTWYGQESDLNR